MKTAKELLLNAAEIVEQGWTQGELARDEHDGVRSTKSAYACKFCMTGAIIRATVDAPDAYQVRLALDAAIKTIRAMGYSTIPQFNDAQEATQADVAEALRKAAVHVP